VRWIGAVALVAGSTLAVPASAASPITATPPEFSGQTPLITGDGPTAVAIADVNGDRKADLVTANYGAKTISVLLNNGGGRFQPHRDYPSSVGAPRWLATVDVDGDGQRDVLTAEPRPLGAFPDTSGGTVSVFINGEGGGLRLQQVYRACTWGGQLGIGDLNGDGKVDFATGASECYWSFGGRAYLFVNDGHGSFDHVGTCGARDGFNPTAIDDVNGDGRQDMVIGNLNSITVWLNDGDWRGDAAGECGGAYGGSYATAGTDSASLALADLNRDGKRDVVTAASRVDAVSVLLNNGGGHFGDHIDYPTGDRPWTVAVGDLNADHRLDLVTANNDGGTVSVLTGKGDGTFEAKRDYATKGGHPWSVAIGDLNGDGLPDLAATNTDNDSVAVFFNRTTVCRIPNVKRKAITDATRVLVRAHCRAGAIGHASSKAAAKGRVIAERPAPGAVLPAGSAVSLVVGRG
jgi:FG-GAP-like repeat/PASTA domain